MASALSGVSQAAQGSNAALSIPAKFSQIINTHVELITRQVLDLLENPQSGPLFLVKGRISACSDPLKGLINRIHNSVADRAKFCLFAKDAHHLVKAGSLLIPAAAFEDLLALETRLTREFSEQFQAFVDGPNILRTCSDVAEFVLKFNRKLGKRDLYLERGVRLLDEIINAAWKGGKEQGAIPNSETISWVRQALFLMYGAEDPMLKERALRGLIEVIECDPIECATAYSLVELQAGLLQEIEAGKTQNLNTTLEPLLVRTYAVTIECILLHEKAGNLNGLAEDVKKRIWDGADKEKTFNITKHEEIAFWAEYASQGVQRIQTEVTELQKWIPRIVVIVKGAIQIASLIKSPQDAPTVLLRVVTDLMEAFRYFEWYHSWYDQLMLLRRGTRYAINDIKAFRKLTSLYQEKIREETNPYFLFGAVATLEQAVFHSPSRLVQEEGIKLLLQFLSATLSKTKKDSDEPPQKRGSWYPSSATADFGCI